MRARNGLTVSIFSLATVCSLTAGVTLAAQPAASGAPASSDSTILPPFPSDEPMPTVTTVDIASITAPATAPATTDATTETTDDTSGTTETTDDSSATTDATTATTAGGDTTPGVGEIRWDPEDEVADGVQLGYLDVPVDYENPDGPTFTLALARHLATDPANRIGTLLVNPGGPGFGGSDLALYASMIYDDALLERFDILGWDPRGTGMTEPAIDCVDDYDRYFMGPDITPDDEAERQEIIDLAQEFADDCVSKNAEILPFVGTNNSARDMNSIRQALGEEKISYFGFSYGSELGATWVTLFPKTVRAAVLDGAADPNADALQSSLDQYAGFEASLNAFLAQCSEDSSCAFHSNGHAEAAFDKLMKQIDNEPLPTEDGRPPLTRGAALTGVANALYSDSNWPTLAQALADAQTGDATGLLAQYDSYYERRGDGTWGDALEAFQSIVCMDSDERPTIEEEDATVDDYQAVAPRMLPNTTGSYFCTFFPPSEDPRVQVTGAGAGPVVVVGTTGDPATPIESSRKMAAALEDGVFVEVEADQHTAYGLNDCINGTIDRYLVDLEVPADDTRC